MIMSPDDAMTKAHPVRRMEVFTGAGHRRTWSDEAKAQIVAESYVGSETVCAVARRYGLAPTQLFGWRREMRRLAPAQLAFAPVVVEPGPEVEPDTGGAEGHTPPRPTQPSRRDRAGDRRCCGSRRTWRRRQDRRRRHSGA